MHDITKSIEDYLEAILNIENSKNIVKSIDVANELKVSKPAVSKATNILNNMGYITKSSYGDIKLTDLGRETAILIYERHLVLKEFLLKIGVCEETAEIDCCKIEHVIS